jgi:hypothetical protein
MPDSHCRATPQVTAVDELFGTHNLTRSLRKKLSSEQKRYAGCASMTEFY